MDDLISRRKLLNRTIYNPLHPPYITEQDVLDCPSEQPERMKGKWIKRGGTINCSVCKHSNWSECFENTVMSFNFCPNCGADMRGEEDECTK